MANKPLREAYRDGLLCYTAGEVIDHEAAIVEVLYSKKDGGKKLYFAEIKGTTLCAHGGTIEEAIEEARLKGGLRSLTPEEKRKYQDPDYRFSVSLFRRLTGACKAGIDAWLEEKGLDSSVKMTLKEFRKAGGGSWADKLSEAIND